MFLNLQGQKHVNTRTKMRMDYRKETCRSQHLGVVVPNWILGLWP